MKTFTLTKIAEDAGISKSYLQKLIRLGLISKPDISSPHMHFYITKKVVAEINKVKRPRGRPRKGE